MLSMGARLNPSISWPSALADDLTARSSRARSWLRGGVGVLGLREGFRGTGAYAPEPFLLLQIRFALPYCPNSLNPNCAKSAREPVHGSWAPWAFIAYPSIGNYSRLADHNLPTTMILQASPKACTTHHLVAQWCHSALFLL